MTYAYAPGGEVVEGWTGVDLDATLAEYYGWRDDGSVGPPIPAMVARVKEWISRGRDVRIMTARIAHAEQRSSQVAIIEAWCLEHIGVILPITFSKDMGMVELWDDRAVSVEANTGRAFRCGEEQYGPA